MQGIRSGRKLATACSEQITFIYLSKGYLPKKTAINDFRKANVSYFKDYFQTFLYLFDKKRKDGSTSIFDGSKIEANASKFQIRKKETYEKWVDHLKADIVTIEQELQNNLEDKAIFRRIIMRIENVKALSCVKYLGNVLYFSFILEDSISACKLLRS